MARRYVNIIFDAIACLLCAVPLSSGRLIRGITRFIGYPFAVDEITEVLGEGSFGRVSKGLWMGTGAYSTHIFAYCVIQLDTCSYLRNKSSSLGLSLQKRHI